MNWNEEQLINDMPLDQTQKACTSCVVRVISNMYRRAAVLCRYHASREGTMQNRWGNILGSGRVQNFSVRWRLYLQFPAPKSMMPESRFKFGEVVRKSVCGIKYAGIDHAFSLNPQQQHSYRSAAQVRVCVRATNVLLAATCPPS